MMANGSSVMSLSLDLNNKLTFQYFGLRLESVNWTLNASKFSRLALSVNQSGIAMFIDGRLINSLKVARSSQIPLKNFKNYNFSIGEGFKVRTSLLDAALLAI